MTLINKFEVAVIVTINEAKKSNENRLLPHVACDETSELHFCGV